MSYDYFYGQSGELFSYFRIPKALFQDHRFRQLSTDARTLYGILLDRMSLSVKNGWLDEQGRVYIIYTVREVQESLCCGEHKAVKLFRELEDIDLIERKRRGLGRPSLIYVKDFSSGLPKAQVQNCPNSNSGAAESAILVQPKPQANKTDKNKTEWNDPDPIYSGGIREQLEDYFYQSLEVDLLLRLCPDDEDTIYQIMDLLVDTCSTKRKILRMPTLKLPDSPYTAEWRIEGKSAMGRGDIISSETYGTSRANAYKILEDTLNLKDVRIYDAIEDEEGKLKRILNKTDTMLAQQKQQVIKDAFANWIWKDPQRRIALVKQYNELFNSSRPREYDGSHIHLVGMNPEITLREHQRNAIAHVLYGGNTLLAHEVGAGKTFEMAASSRSKAIWTRMVMLDEWPPRPAVAFPCQQAGTGTDLEQDGIQRYFEHWLLSAKNGSGRLLPAFGFARVAAHGLSPANVQQQSQPVYQSCQRKRSGLCRRSGGLAHPAG